jgi:hypothetical protein
MFHVSSYTSFGDVVNVEKSSLVTYLKKSNFEYRVTNHLLDVGSI